MIERIDLKKRKEKERVVLLVIAIVVFICACVYIGFYIYNLNMAEKESDFTTTPQTTGAQAEDLADNPVDFDSLQDQNEEIYAWIKIEDTDVDYPIVKSEAKRS